MKRLIWFAVFAAMFALPGTGFCAGLIIVDDTHWWPGPVPPPWPSGPVPPFPRPPHLFAPLDVESVRATTHIDDQVATTKIDQEFFNPNAARLEGTFVFPVPKGAHIDKFTMQIDGRNVEAELLRADKARCIYEDIVRRMKDPALLEYAGQDVFKVRIFPIEPNSRKKVSISYTQLLTADDGLLNYVLPLGTEKYSAKPVKNVSVKVELETRRPLKSVYSPSHAVEVKRNGSNRATAGYEASDIQPGEDFSLYYSSEKNELGMNLLAHRVSGEDGFFLLLASPGVEPREKVIKKDVVFVLDTSGSMAGKKLEQARRALEFCVENLNEGDRFELIRFSTEVEPLFDKLVDASKENRSRAEDFIKGLRPIGGTAIDDALKQALALSPKDSKDSGRVFVVLFLTDGRPTIGPTDDEQILADVRKLNDSHTRVFCFGIGTDVNTHLLDKITEETRAFSQYVLPEEDLELKVSSFFSKIKEPVLSNPTLKFTGNVRVTKMYPNPLPDLFKGEQLVVAGQYTGDGDSAVIIEGSINGKNRKFTYEVKFPGRQEENEFIPRLWATRRVGYLLDEIRLHGENSELRDEVTDLARKYGIVTPYTAYLIMEDETRRNVPVAMQSLQDFGKDRQVREEASRSWEDYRMKTDGESAVAGARLNMKLRSAVAAAPAATATAVESQRALGLYSYNSLAGADADKKNPNARLVQYSQQTQFAGGKNFFLNGTQWTDSEIQKRPDAKRVRIQFGSPEYLQLAAEKPKAQAWLALGQEVQFRIADSIYEIYK